MSTCYPRAMPYSQWQTLHFPKQGPLFYEARDGNTYEVTPDFDMVICGQRIRPQLATVYHGDGRGGYCKHTRVKAWGVMRCGKMVYYPKMYSTSPCN